MTSPVTAQNPAIQGMSSQQQGSAPSFPVPLGIEQYLGQPQQYAGLAQQYGGQPQQSYLQSQFPGQQPILGQQQFQVQQIAQSLLTQLLPVAHQVILPQVLATAMQQIPMYLQQLCAQVAQQVTAQQAVGQFGQQWGGQQGSWQQPQFSQQGAWQPQPQFAQQGQGPFGRGF
jgi:hypothetical protein